MCNWKKAGQEVPHPAHRPPAAAAGRQRSDFRLCSLLSFAAFTSDLKLFGRVNTTFADCLAKLKRELLLILERFA